MTRILLSLHVAPGRVDEATSQSRSQPLARTQKMLPRLYAFDVDDTLEISDGPVPLAALRQLREEGHIVGLCGNWALFVRKVPAWHRLVSFLGPIQFSSKADFLGQLRMYITASDYILVGNDPVTGWGSSADREAAELAGWRFLREAEFAAGAR
jgi:hypothetical protein